MALHAIVSKSGFCEAAEKGQVVTKDNWGPLPVCVLDFRFSSRYFFLPSAGLLVLMLPLHFWSLRLLLFLPDLLPSLLITVSLCSGRTRIRDRGHGITWTGACFNWQCWWEGGVFLPSCRIDWIAWTLRNVNNSELVGKVFGSLCRNVNCKGFSDS